MSAYITLYNAVIHTFYSYYYLSEIFNLNVKKYTTVIIIYVYIIIHLLCMTINYYF